MCAWRLLLLAALPALVGVGAGEVLEVAAAAGAGEDAEAAPAFLPTRRGVTAAPGGEAALVCRVAHLGDKAVSWVRARDLQILAHAGQVFAADPRVAAAARAERGTATHTLRIAALRAADAGRYECQLNTEPKLSQIYNLTVTEAARRSVEVLEVFPLEAREARAPAGGVATLGCGARLRGAGAPGPRALRVAWLRAGRVLLPQSGRAAGGVALDAERAAGRVAARLTLAALTPADAGRYVCVVSADADDDDDADADDDGGDAPRGELALTLVVTGAGDEGVGETEAMQRDQSPAPGGAPRAAPASLLLALLLPLAARALEPLTTR